MLNAPYTLFISTVLVKIILLTNVISSIYSTKAFESSQAPAPTISSLEARCLSCIRNVSAQTGVDVQKRCSEGVYYCGQYQLSYTYWAEAGKPGNNNGGKDYEKCAKDRSCSEQAVRAYFKKFKRDCNNDGLIDCLDMAALHKGGPTSCSSDWIYKSKFWQAFNKTECITQRDSTDNQQLKSDQLDQPDSLSNGQRPMKNQSLTSECLDCICDAVSGCNTSVNNCGSGTVCGPFAISQAYWKDGRKPGASWTTCARTKECSSVTMKNYMEKYKRDCNGDGFITCEDYAAIHRRGARACSNKDLLKDHYWNKFLACRANQLPTKDVNMVKVGTESSNILDEASGTNQQQQQHNALASRGDISASPQNVPQTTVAPATESTNYEIIQSSPTSTTPPPPPSSPPHLLDVNYHPRRQQHPQHSQQNYQSTKISANQIINNNSNNNRNLIYSTTPAASRVEFMSSSQTQSYELTPINSQTKSHDDELKKLQQDNKHTVKLSSTTSLYKKTTRAPTLPDYDEVPPIILIKQPSQYQFLSTTTSTTTSPPITTLQHSAPPQKLSTTLIASQTTSKSPASASENYHQSSEKKQSHYEFIDSHGHSQFYPSAVNSNSFSNNNNHFSRPQSNEQTSGSHILSQPQETQPSITGLSAQSVPSFSQVDSTGLISSATDELDFSVPDFPFSSSSSNQDGSANGGGTGGGGVRSPSSFDKVVLGIVGNPDFSKSYPPIPELPLSHQTNGDQQVEDSLAFSNSNQNQLSSKSQQKVNTNHSRHPPTSNNSKQNSMIESSSSFQAAKTSTSGTSQKGTLPSSTPSTSNTKTTQQQQQQKQESKQPLNQDNNQNLNIAPIMDLVNMTSLFEKNGGFSGLNESSRIASECLECICDASSNCDTSVQCISKQREKNRCGLYMISWNQYQESDISLTSFMPLPPGVSEELADEKLYYECTTDRVCAEKLIHLYIEKHQRDCNNDGKIDCYDIAAIHRVGPESCNSSKFLSSQYWKDFSMCYNSDRLTTVQTTTSTTAHAQTAHPSSPPTSSNSQVVMLR